MKDQTPFVSKPPAAAGAEPPRPRQSVLRRLAAIVKSTLAEPEANGAARRASAVDGVFQPRKY